MKNNDLFKTVFDLPVNERPKKIAELVHAVQQDKSGAAYIEHPAHVTQNAKMLAIRLGLTQTETEAAIAIAWLHDVIEDSGDQPCGPVSQQDLSNLGISTEILTAVNLLTRVRGERDKSAYYIRLLDNPLARLVKIADIADNRNLERRSTLSASDAQYLEQKYSHALSILELSPVEETFYQKRMQSPCVLEDYQEAALSGL